MQIQIIKPGLLSTIQDMGRQQYLSQAVPASGAMDTLSARIANKAVGNADSDAVIEFTYADASFVTDTDVLLAYSGGGATLIADEQTLPRDRPIFITAGTTVKLITEPSGSRTYLAIAGGWDVPEVLGSRSTFLTAGFGGFDGRALNKGDVLNNRKDISDISQRILKSLSGAAINYPLWSVAFNKFLSDDRKTIRIVSGNELRWFSDKSVTDLLSAPFTIDQQSNRMGYRLNGPALERVNTGELLSTAVTPGTVQVTGNGSMIMLMADCQTTGGYPRIAQIAAVDLPLCAQLKPGDTIYFKQIGRREAEKLYIERELQLQQLTIAIATKY